MSAPVAASALRSIAALAVIACLCLASHAFAADSAARVKPTDIAIPEGAMLGQIRRIMHPFPNWTLICDEDLKARTKVCNVTETFVDASGKTVFSWSLAATENGSPVFILRAPASIGPDGTITLRLSNAREIAVPVEACDPNVCIATLLLDRDMRGMIQRAEPVTFRLSGRETATILAPLYGLAKAVAAIDRND
ncbi:invasion associated locus B family protein [Mesorhizobium sp. KR9-304]|uniref:invasion associated locus B family protein n=1 Tax=Mesorhizobium sp. KR9-304 TaxID=3156614 RepID=UPI0032B60D92